MNIDQATLKWFKSSRSNGQANCVEAAFVGDQVAVRDSKAGGVGPVMVFDEAVWMRFIAGVTHGRLTQS